MLEKDHALENATKQYVDKTLGGLFPEINWSTYIEPVDPKQFEEDLKEMIKNIENNK